ncbi:CRISPR-associated protein Cas5 [Falsiruegeria mediterranea]
MSPRTKPPEQRIRTVPPTCHRLRPAQSWRGPKRRSGRSSYPNPTRSESKRRRSGDRARQGTRRFVRWPASQSGAAS